MALTKEVVVDQITIVEDGTVMYRQATRILEDGKQISETFHRTSLYPGQDVAGQPAQVVSICSLVWTPAVVASFQKKMEDSLNKFSTGA